MAKQSARSWTVVRFPAGMWSTGGDPSCEDYQGCEVYLVPADSREQATRKAQSVRGRLIKNGAALPSQAAPYSF